jgi:flagellar protein FliT
MLAHKQMNFAQAIENYEILAALTAQMRTAAEHGNWEELIRIEKQCDSLIASMKKIDADTNQDESTRRHKTQLIQKILADEDEIRNLTHEWMEQLQNQISSNRQEQRLQQAYGSSVD